MLLSALQVTKPVIGEMLMLHVGSFSTQSVVTRVKKSDACIVRVRLQTPVCCEVGSQLTLSRRAEGHWR